MSQLEADIGDVNQIFKDLAAMVHDQGEMVDSIEANVESASIHVNEGADDLRMAERYQNKARRKKLCLAATGLIVLIILIAIIASAAKNWDLHDYNRSRQKILYLAALAAIALSILILIVWARGWTTIQAERKNGQQCSDDIAANRALAKFHLIINFNGYKLVLHYLYNLDFLFSPESLSCTHIFRANS